MVRNQFTPAGPSEPTCQRSEKKNEINRFLFQSLSALVVNIERGLYQLCNYRTSSSFRELLILWVTEEEGGSSLKSLVGV